MDQPIVKVDSGGNRLNTPPLDGWDELGEIPENQYHNQISAFSNRVMASQLRIERSMAHLERSAERTEAALSRLERSLSSVSSCILVLGAAVTLCAFLVGF